MSLEFTKSQNSSPVSAVTVSAPKSQTKAPAAGADSADKSDFTGMLDAFSDAPEADTQASGDSEAVTKKEATSKDLNARRKLGRQGDEADLNAAEASAPTDWLTQMALMAEAARQAAAAVEPTPATVPVDPAAGASTDPALMAAVVVAASPITLPAQVPVDAGQAVAESATPTVTPAVAEGAMPEHKGARDVLSQLQSQLQALDQGAKHPVRDGASSLLSAASATDAPFKGLATGDLDALGNGAATQGNDLGASLQALVSKADASFKDMAARALDTAPLGGVADDVSKALSAMLEPEKTRSERRSESGAKASDGAGGSWMPPGDSQDRLQPLGVAAAGASDTGQAMTDSQSRSPEDVVAEQVSYWINQKRQGAELTLDGGNGQPVAVSISMNGNEANVVFRSDQAATRDMLNGALPELRTLLQSEGLILSGVSVGAGQGQSGQPGRQGQAAAEGGTRRAALGGVGRVEAEPAGTVLRRQVSTNQALDLFV
ncbi:flagellar hook-length control protein FliK [Curvibacter sp. HBC28]|uniref:Flagellar hook-length control protein FliK n=1 Tax=Curvibacter microcysteis TaxID=3026419 RepID=A0ABT5MJ91_9BURK|nr:flagellar hook-length control protein FliK [Curvibacter sp. HBC28]MDD0816598.1 flagellar hook-length control protein FliK [Curvibacter sp. HBC28]